MRFFHCTPDCMNLQIRNALALRLFRTGCLVVFAFLSLLSQSTQQTPADTRIRLGVSMSPNLSGVSASATVLVTLTNRNSASAQTLEPGDRFTLSFDLGD